MAILMDWLLTLLLTFAKTSTMIDVWKEIKLATNEICISKGGTVTHHHAVGRDHRPNGYDNQRPELFKEILTAK